MNDTAEHRRLTAHEGRVANWKQWGPYLSERAWGTVREDYSPHGDAWSFFSHDQARSRAYRWNEDGLAGISDESQYLCFAIGLWNGRDTILKERLFGLTGPEGNHGEDVKETYYYLDNTPTHSYMKLLYKYPQAAFPYEDLVAENGQRSFEDAEYELSDTGIFEGNRYFDVTVEYAKAAADDILVRVTITNRGPETAGCLLLPTLWFRNTWSWGYLNGPMGNNPGRPLLKVSSTADGVESVLTQHPRLGTYHLYADTPGNLLFTENETNTERLYGRPARSAYVKDAFHRYLIAGEEAAVNPERKGTKAAFVHELSIPPGESVTCWLRLSAVAHVDPFADAESIMERRIAEADEFYKALQPADLSADGRNIQRQALAGMLWSKQLYYFDVKQWLEGDPGGPPPPSERHNGRNSDWTHLNNFDILSMPDKWEYPWFAAWDLAFHCLPLALVDPAFAKDQLIQLTRVWYMHPNGQLPAYEWEFSEVNPPVHAWAAWQVYRLEARRTGRRDTNFLERIFHKMLLNFTWWVNRKDEEGLNVFQGGFLGLDNISVFDRSALLPTGGHIDQSDGTAWMGFYCLTMMKIALELAQDNKVYEDLATKFYEHFLGIATAMTSHGAKGFSLWDETDQFFYDALHLSDGRMTPLRVRSMVGLIPLLAVETLEPSLREQLPSFHRRLRWFARNRPELSGNMASVSVPGKGERLIAAIPTRKRLVSILRYMLDENEFMGDYGIRSLSKFHARHPYSIETSGRTFSIDYQPAESRSGLFGGNSNWRGPIWFPINYLLIEALRKYHTYYGDDLLIECPTNSGNWSTLEGVADILSQRLLSIFLRDENGQRPLYGDASLPLDDPGWRDYLLFHEYFHGDSGAGLGASHQTGWTGLVANLLQGQDT